MDRSEITKYKDKLLGKLFLYRDYDNANGLRRKVLLVEGATDKSFIGHIISTDTRCITVGDFMNSNNVFYTSHIPAVSRYSSKGVIVTILKDISVPVISAFPKGAENWPLYGLVDDDYNDSNSFLRVTKLFFTDTHDLETLMLSTDSKLLSKLEQCKITADEIKVALYIAKQLSAFRQAIINDSTLTASLINSSDGTIDFDKFIERDKISLAKILNYINSKMEKPVPKEKLKRCQEAIRQNMKRLLDKDGIWKKGLDVFSIDNKLWNDINGHDILAAIRYKNPRAKEAFSNQSNHKQNRDFEFALTTAYDYNCLKKTKLYQKLFNAGLLQV